MVRKWFFSMIEWSDQKVEKIESCVFAVGRVLPIQNSPEMSSSAPEMSSSAEKCRLPPKKLQSDGLKIIENNFFLMQS